MDWKARGEQLAVLATAATVVSGIFAGGVAYSQYLARQTTMGQLTQWAQQPLKWRVLELKAVEGKTKIIKESQGFCALSLIAPQKFAREHMAWASIVVETDPLTGERWWTAEIKGPDAQPNETIAQVLIVELQSVPRTAAPAPDRYAAE